MSPTKCLKDQRGFTMIELLTTTSIIGLLAAIGIPSFTAQRSKAYDTEAIVNVRSAVSTLESMRTALGTYDVTVEQMIDSEDSLREAHNLSVSGTDASFVITVESEGGASSGGVFTFSRDSSGVNTKTCSNAGQGRCKPGGTW